MQAVLDGIIRVFGEENVMFMSSMTEGNALIRENFVHKKDLYYFYPDDS